MDAKLVSLFQREATARLNAAEHELVAYTRTCRGKVIELPEMTRIRHLRWTRYRLLAESGVN
ncbi:hypothetical protein [Hyphomicrobium sp. MC8b]|uniref:hypothetical protein n=1 Tax=Hyphomicrobium sp. MC8b TaxID=300273 RepID=UPI00391DED2B